MHIPPTDGYNDILDIYSLPLLKTGFYGKLCENFRYVLNRASCKRLYYVLIPI